MWEEVEEGGQGGTTHGMGACGRARWRAAATRAKPRANSQEPTPAPEAAATEPRCTRAWVARGLAPEARGRAPEADRGRSSPRSWALPAGGPQPPRLSERQRQRMPHGAARPAPELWSAEKPAAHWRLPRCVPAPLRVPAPSAAAAASRLLLLPLREPPLSPPPPLPLPAGAQPVPAAPESSRSRSRCPRPRHERKRRRRGRRRSRLSSRGRRALPASVVVSQAGPRRARAPAPPARPTAPARAPCRRPPQPSGPRASPAGRPGWRRLRPSAGSRYGVQERARRGGAWVDPGDGGGQRRAVQQPGPTEGVERCPGQVCPAPEPLGVLRPRCAERLTKRFPTQLLTAPFLPPAPRRVGRAGPLQLSAGRRRKLRLSGGSDLPKVT